MIKTITLMDRRIARIDSLEPFYLPYSESLVLSFEQGNYNLVNAFIFLRNGTLAKQFPYSKTFEIPEEFLFEGLLEIKVQRMKKNECVNVWNVLPIKIRYVENVSNPYGDKVIYDYCYSLEQRIKALEEQMPKGLFDEDIPQSESVLEEIEPTADEDSVEEIPTEEGV